MIIDAHQHFWKYSPRKHHWVKEHMSAIKRDFLPEDLLLIFKKYGIDACVAIQADQSEEETDYLLDLADKYDYIKGVVGWVDLRANHLSKRLDYYSKFEKMKGFRHLVQDELDPDFLLGADFQRGLNLLEKHGFTYDLLVYPDQLNAAIQTVRNFPGLNFVLDHMAKPDIKNGKMTDWSRSMKTMAQEKNIYCKISGMVTEASLKGWKPEDFDPYLDVIFNFFGTERIMFGSDWPVCLLAGDYGAVLNLVTDYTRGFSDQDKLKIFSKNAIDFYRLS